MNCACVQPFTYHYNSILHKLCIYKSSETFLKKLLEVADMPQARTLFDRGRCNSPFPTSHVLVQLSHSCVSADAIAGGTKWIGKKGLTPTALEMYTLDWEKNFVGPVQDCILKVYTVYRITLQQVLLIIEGF